MPHVRKQIPEGHEQQEPSDQTKKPDDDIGLPAGDCCSMPPGGCYYRTFDAESVCVDLSQGAKEGLWVHMKKRGLEDQIFKTIPSNCEGQS